jgi:hypothetical protein
LAPVALEAASALAFATAKLVTIASAKLITISATVASAELVTLAGAATITLTSAETIRSATTQTVTLASAEFAATTEFIPTTKVAAPAEFFASAEFFPPAESLAPAESFASALATAQHAEHGEPPLLAVVEALVERVGSVSQFLQRRTGFRQDLRTPTQALGRIHVIALLPLTARSAECIDAREALHREFAGRLFEGRPVALLLRRQHETRAQRAQPRFRESTHILDIRLPTLKFRPALTLLRIDQRRTRNHKSSSTGKDGF